MTNHNGLKVFVDLDGILCDFIEGVSVFYGRPNPYLLPENAGKWGVHELLSMTPEDFWGPLDEEFWYSLPLTEEASTIMEILLKFFQEENICFLSSPTLHPGSLSGKFRWINKHFPSFSRRFFIGPPKHFCAHSRALLIDDYEYNVEEFRKHGGEAILLPRPWNRLHHISLDKSQVTARLESKLNQIYPSLLPR